MNVDVIGFKPTILFKRSLADLSISFHAGWQTLKLNITRVWLQDIYGPPNIISVEDYLKANLKRRTSFY